MVVRLINVETVNSEGSSDRHLDTWFAGEGKNLRWTCWKNHNKSPQNPYKYNRVKFHYNHEDGRTIRKSYFCIHNVIEIDEMTFEGFDADKVDKYV